MRSPIALPSFKWFIVLILGWATPPVSGESESTLRHNLAWQIGLEHVGFSPGLIDGRIGPKTRLATRELQRVHGLKVTGELDEATKAALEFSPAEVIGRYTVRQADLDEIGPVPKSWIARSKLKRLGHESLDWVIAERFHCTRGLLNRLNPGMNIKALKPGDKLNVPKVLDASSPPRAKRLEVNLGEKVIRVIDDQNRLVALFHCSIAAERAKLPDRDARVVAIAPDPTYALKPSMWPEVTEKIDRTLIIPPGPRNPVGRCWISLSLPGYGMHGTPNPELIGKTGSHGCFRLANWDALRLAEMVRPGTPIKFLGHDDAQVASR